MAITFFNINSGETKTVETEPAISAYYNSSNQHVNALVGQDFGWRLGLDTIARMNEIKGNGQLMDRIAQAFQLPLGEVADTDVVRWISLEDARQKAQEKVTEQNNFAEDYANDLKALNTNSAKQTDSAKISESKTNAKEK